AVLAPPDGAQQVERLRAGELLAREAGDEAAAANLAARLHAAERTGEVAPGRRQRLPDQEVAEDDAPPRQELAGEGFGPRAGRRRDIGSREQGPAAGGMPRAGRSRAPLAPPALGVHQGPEVVEAVGGHQPGG